jgi:hypothetical protein
MGADSCKQSYWGVRVLKGAYILLLIVMAFTGMGQMPIFKRYYIADIPGMGWSADYFLTHYIHYLGAASLLALFSYVAADYLLSGRKAFKLTASAWVRLVFLAGLVITGVFRVLKNLPHITFSPDFTLFIDIAHMAFMVLFVLTALIFLIARRGWVVGRGD